MTEKLLETICSWKTRDF